MPNIYSRLKYLVDHLSSAKIRNTNFFVYLSASKLPIFTSAKITYDIFSCAFGLLLNQVINGYICTELQYYLEAISKWK